MANIVFIKIFLYQYVVSMSVTWVVVIVVYNTDKSVYILFPNFAFNQIWVTSSFGVCGTWLSLVHWEYMAVMKCLQ